MKARDLLNITSQIKVIHPIHGKCRVMSVGQKALRPKVTGVQLSPDSNPSEWVQITDYENLTQVAWDWEHDPTGEERKHWGIST